MLNQPGSFYAHEKLSGLRREDLARKALQKELLRSIERAESPRTERKPRGVRFLPLPRFSLR